MFKGRLLRKRAFTCWSNGLGLLRYMFCIRTKCSSSNSMWMRTCFPSKVREEKIWDQVARNLSNVFHCRVYHLFLSDIMFNLQLFRKLLPQLFESVPTLYPDCLYIMSFPHTMLRLQYRHQLLPESHNQTLSIMHTDWLHHLSLIDNMLGL